MIRGLFTIIDGLRLHLEIDRYVSEVSTTIDSPPFAGWHELVELSLLVDNTNAMTHEEMELVVDIVDDFDGACINTRLHGEITYFKE